MKRLILVFQVDRLAVDVRPAKEALRHAAANAAASHIRDAIFTVMRLTILGSL